MRLALEQKIRLRLENLRIPTIPLLLNSQNVEFGVESESRGCLGDIRLALPLKGTNRGRCSGTSKRHAIHAQALESEAWSSIGSGLGLKAARSEDKLSVPLLQCP